MRYLLMAVLGLSLPGFGCSAGGEAVDRQPRSHAATRPIIERHSVVGARIEAAGVEQFAERATLRGRVYSSSQWGVAPARRIRVAAFGPGQELIWTGTTRLEPRPVTRRSRTPHQATFALALPRGVAADRLHVSLVTDEN